MELDLATIVAPSIVALIVGLVSGWLGSQKAIAVAQAELAQVKQDVDGLRKDLVAVGERERATAETLIEIKTRLDVLLMFNGKDAQWNQSSQSSQS